MRRFKTYLTAAAFLGPFLLLLVIFQGWPLATMVRDSTRKFSFLNPDEATSVGLDNYRALLDDPMVVKSLQVTVLFSLGLVVLVIPLGLALALFVNQRFRGVKALRALIFTPVVTSVVVIATLWTFLLDPGHGLANTVLGAVGIDPQPFVTSTGQALPSLVVMTVWAQVGFAMILFLSGLQSIPGELLEAASIDGANPWQTFWRVKLPLLRRTTLFVVVIMTVFSFQAFAPAYVMTGGGPESSTVLFVYYIYQSAFTYLRAGYAEALSVLLMAIILVVSSVQLFLLRTKESS
ncbi:sugar ABC transporter permease [Longispora sp. NPDC051575]|uniref:carbohydrate ABC transporter permease n=1 Tax=Longispora sp. NPDC051575 TaxID=3154943 RepID=UPI00341CCDB6